MIIQTNNQSIKNNSISKLQIIGFFFKVSIVLGVLGWNLYTCIKHQLKYVKCYHTPNLDVTEICFSC